jgi:hypothetical protein
VVGEIDAAEAREFAERFDRETAHEPAEDGQSNLDDMAEPEPADWPDWPTCPECGKRRAARCPICHNSGTRFELVDIQETEGGQRVLLHCDTCDDHFLPEFFRLCHHCGHDYGDGVEIEQPAAWAIEWNIRAAAVAIGLVMGVALLLAYFVWVLRQP